VTDHKPATHIVALLGLVTLFMGGCDGGDSFDFCQNHYQVHADHNNTIALLDGQLDTAGLLTMRLHLPANVLADGAATASESSVLLELLASPDRVYSLESDQPCAAATVKVNELGSGLGSGLDLEYQSQCSVGNRVRQVNVELFGLLDGLEEVEVNMETPAVSKHFAISRLCKQAIFRLTPPGKSRAQN